jgi:GT2 family glycosyltransferase
MSKNKHPNRLTVSLIDIIIPVLDNIELLMNCLISIPDAVNDVSYQIIVVDNGSEPERIKYYRDFGKDKFKDKFHVLEQHKNTGFPAACNRGARFGYSPLLFFLNDDVKLYPNSIDKLVRVMDDPTVGAVGMKLLFPLDSKDPKRPAGKIQHVGLSTNIKGDFIHNFVGWSPDNPRVLRIKESYAITGAAMMTRKNLFQKTKGFDEAFGIGTYEDVFYCLLLREMGYNIRIEQEAIGEHYVGATAMDKKIQYPLQHNQTLLHERMGNKLLYTEWEIW